MATLLSAMVVALLLGLAFGGHLPGASPAGAGSGTLRLGSAPAAAVAAQATPSRGVRHGRAGRNSASGPEHRSPKQRSHTKTPTGSHAPSPEPSLIAARLEAACVSATVRGSATGADVSVHTPVADASAHVDTKPVTKTVRTAGKKVADVVCHVIC
jgi:hypothetical protein